MATLLNGFRARGVSMNRSAAMGIIAIALAGYGTYTAVYVPPLVTSGHSPFLLASYAVQACAALLAAVGLWRASSWAPAVVIILGAAVAATELVEAFIMGIIAYLPAIAISVVVLVATIAVGVSASRTRHV